MLVDNNVLSSLAKIDRLALLGAVFDDVAATVSVLDELHADAVAGYAFVDRIDGIKAYEDGWLRIVSPGAAEIERTEEILDASLSYTDAELIAIAGERGHRLLTDDEHVGRVAASRGVEVWDLALLLRTAGDTGAIGAAAELETVIAELRAEDYYEFSEADERYLFEPF